MNPKVRIYSDLHLEFDCKFDPGTGDVLILAGDICLACEVREPGIQKFFNQCAAGYNKVFYVMGNHEYYGNDIHTAKREIIDNIPSSITILDNNSEFYKGWNFVGSTMWSDFHGHNEGVMKDAGQMMNDYNYITKNGRKLTPEMVFDMHHETMHYFENVLPTLKGPVFMITHHQPSLKSLLNSKYNQELGGAYCTDLIDFISQYYNIRYWAAGHIHESQDYSIGHCNVLSNPRGYHPEALNPSFDSQFTRDICNK